MTRFADCITQGKDSTDKCKERTVHVRDRACVNIWCGKLASVFNVGLMQLYIII